MRKRKWYERMSAAVLIAVLLVNHGDMGIMAKAETITALEENLEEENKKIEAEIASASNADEKRDTTVDSNETTESDLEKETATASNGKETLETKRKMAKRAMNAEPVTGGTYSISQPTEGTFQVSGGSLEGDGTSATDLTDAIEKILNDRADKKVTIDFDNINISGNVPTLKQGCELTLTGSYEKTGVGAAFYIGANGDYIIHNKAKITAGDNNLYYREKDVDNATVLFEQEAEELTARFELTAKDTVCLKGGTINGRGFGNGGHGHIEITDGIWNGQLYGIKKIDIRGGNIHYEGNTQYAAAAIDSCEEVSISGGEIYAKNTNTAGKACAIKISKQTKLTLAGNINMSAETGDRNGSIYFDMGESYTTIDAVNLKSVNDNFKVVVSDLAMNASSSLTNWIKGSDENITDLVKWVNANLKFVNKNNGQGDADKYQNYIAKAVGNYIRIMSRDDELSSIPEGNIESADIQLSSGATDYRVIIMYDQAEAGHEKEIEITYDATKATVSGIIDEILMRNTGTDGLEITVGTTENPITGDITVDSGNADDGKAMVLLKGKITGKVNVVGTGTLKSAINCSGFNGNTNSTIHIVGGEIRGAENATDAVITLTSANLIVDGENTHILDQSKYPTQNRYAISAIGGVSVTINNGLIESTNNTAVYINRLGSSGLQEDHAKFEMTGGTIKGGEYGLKHTQLNEITLSGGTISGAASKSDVYMANGRTGTSGTASFKVNGNFPFSSMQIESASVKNEIDFTKATVTEEEKIQINLPWDGSDTESNAKLFKASISNYRDLLDHITLSGGKNPIFAVNNEKKISENPETTEIYVFSSPAWNTVCMKYYKNLNSEEPFYQEYLVNDETMGRSYPSKVRLSDGELKFSTWRYKEEGARKGTAYDEETTVDQLVDNTAAGNTGNSAKSVELYAGYNVSIDASVDDTDITKDSAIIKGKTAGTTVYYTANSNYKNYTGETLRNAAKSTEKQSDFTSVEVEDDGTFSIPLTGLDPLKEYTYYLVAESSNMDVSDNCRVTFNTKARVLTAADFRIVGDKKFTYDGTVHSVEVIPTSENTGLFGIDGGVAQYKKKNGEVYTDEFVQPHWAGTYGVYVSTNSENPGIERAEQLWIDDITIEKADFNPNWFITKSSIEYGEDDNETLSPIIKNEYSTAGSNTIITGYGKIEFEFYKDENLTEVVSRNIFGHYDVPEAAENGQSSYYIGITCTEGENIKAETGPVLLSEINVSRAQYTSVDVTCDNIRYGETPSPNASLKNIDGSNEYTADGNPVKFVYSQDPNGTFEEWKNTNKPGKWYVKAIVNQSQNYNEATSDSVEFEVSKAKLVPSVSAVKSKIYDGNTNAEGTLILSSADGNPILSEDAAGLEAKGTFTWTSKDAGTNTVNVTGIALDSKFEDRYELTTSELSNVSCSGAKIENAQIKNVSVRQMMELTYNGSEQLPEVTATGSTIGGTAITFRYGLTAEQAADKTRALKKAPPFTNAGTYTVYYTASAENHDSVSGSFEIEIKNASITGVDAAGYTGSYDGQSHGIKITLTGNAGDGEILYGESEDNCTLTESPVYKNTGSYTVYYTVTKKNFDTISGSATVAITPAPLTVTAESRNVTYKDEPPVYSSTFEGFVNGENTEVLGGTLSYECAYAVGSDVDEYEIIPSGLTAENGNYEITYQPGKLTVSQAKPEFKLRNLDQLNRVYDAKNTAPEAWTDSDGNVTVTIKMGGEILTEAPMNAGIYTVEVHAEAGKNYEAGSQIFSFEIKKAPLSVKAVDQNVTVGDTIPEYTVLYEGFAGTDTADVLNGSLQFTCEYAPDSAAGDYAIQPSGLTSENYEIHFENGTLHAVRRASSGSGDSDNSDGSGSTKNPATTNFGKNVSNSSSSENDAQGTWKCDEKGWWFEFKDGTYPAGEKTSDHNGEKLGWIQKDGKWWAFGSDGYLKRGWAQDNASGKWYLIDENTGMQTSWHYDESDQHWYYLDPASGAMLTGWQFINGKWYYLSKTSGAVPLGSMYKEIRTPDGYYVDKDGAWDGLEIKEK